MTDGDEEMKTGFYQMDGTKRGRPGIHWLCLKPRLAGHAYPSGISGHPSRRHGYVQDSRLGWQVYITIRNNRRFAASWEGMVNIFTVPGKNRCCGSPIYRESG